MLTLMSVFLASLIIGSFANSIIYRLPRGINFVSHRSHCPNCKKILPALELIPIISFLKQKGKCKSCNKKIASRYLIVEIVFSLGLTLLYWMYGPTYLFFKIGLFFFITTCIFFTDLETTIIPDTLSYSLLSVGLIFAIKEQNLSESLSGGLTGFLMFFIIWCISQVVYKQDAMGIGDIKLITGIGTYWGWKHIILTTYSSFLIGSIVGICLILIKKKSRKDLMPFGPAIVIASFVMIFYQDLLWSFLSRN